ncbi:MAG: carboxypeptidase-like regulatory domain-containing protein [Bacteroides sp.]|nr:carboxypeptidase-like regulatory domain-containing protein [Bacteroides sp.]MCI1682726.1 carboxypeptidase-like regulatory domain-containing protein [Bacteroides sp.]
MTILICMVCLVSSCSDDDENTGTQLYGTVTGIVTDDLSSPLSGVTVTVDDTDITATTNTQGTYSLEDVPVGTHIITFTKEDYQTVSVTVTAAKFNEDLMATINPYMEYAAAKIRGMVMDAKANDTPLAGVTVSISSQIKTTTSSNGTFEISNLPLANYTVTFEKAGYATIVKSAPIEGFVDGITTINIRMGDKEILRNLTIDDLKQAEKWYYNEYRGGRNSESYPHWDWACDYMCTLNFQGAWDEQNEGTTLQIRNSADEQKTNPADLEMFDSFVYGSKAVTSDNNIMTLQIRTHSASDDAPVYYGVQVVDLTEANPQAKLIGGIRTLNSETYVSVPVDLSEYIGKEVIIAIGTFRQQAGDYWKQLVLRRIAFAKEAVEGWGWLPGTEVPGLEDWKMTIEMIRSTMPQTKTSFTGLSPIRGNRDNYKDAYRSWRDVAHIGAEWSFMPIRKDPEVFPSEGFLIKTRGGNNVSTTVPESYFYAKFAITTGKDQLTFKTRNFSSNATFFKITAIQEDGTITHLQPISNTAAQAEAAADGCWKFVHQDGGSNNPEAYASFVYDLSQFDGQNVVIVLGVYKGEANGDENKLVINSISLE